MNNIILLSFNIYLMLKSLMFQIIIYLSWLDETKYLPSGEQLIDLTMPIVLNLIFHNYKINKQPICPVNVLISINVSLLNILIVWSSLTENKSLLSIDKHISWIPPK